MLLWVEGFEEFAAAAGNAPTGLEEKYVVVQADQSTLVNGRTAGLGLKLADTSANSTLATPSFGNNDVWIWGIGYKPGDALLSQRIAVIYDGASEQFGVWSTSSGQIEVRRGSTLVATSAAAPLTPQTFVYIECKVTIANAGSYEVRVSGTDILSGSADTQDTANAYGQTMRLWSAPGTANAPTFDDWYIADDSAGNVTDFLGSHRAITLYPNGEGDLIEWTPSTGTDNSALVDDVPHDTDATYVESNTTGQQDLYTFQDAVLVQIAGVQINAVCRETDATPFSIKLVAKSGATTDEGSGVAIGSTSYVTRSRVLEEDPDTTAAWDDAGIDAAQFGIEIV